LLLSFALPAFVFFSFFFYYFAAHRDLHFSLHDALPISGRAPSSGRRSSRDRDSSAGRHGGGGGAHRLDELQRGRLRALQFIQSRSEEHTSELQSRSDLVCRLLLEKKKKKNT